MPRPLELTFTPPANGTVKVKAVFDCAGYRTDLGASPRAQTFCEQGGTTVYGLAHNPLRQRQTVVLEDTFTVTGGSEVKAGLYGAVPGANVITFWAMDVQADFTPA